MSRAASPTDNSPLLYSPHVGTASLMSSVINMANTIIGAGVLALPHALSQTSLFWGVVMLIFSGFTSYLGLYFISRCAARLPPGKASFAAVAKRTFPSLAVFFDIAIAVKCFGVSVSYLIIVGDLMPQIANSMGFTSAALSSRHFWITVSIIVLIPFSFLRKLDSLRHTSLISLIALSYLVVMVMFHYFAADTVRGEVSYFTPASASGFLSVIPVFVFGFTCHMNAFSIVNESKNKAHGHLALGMFLAVFVSLIVYLIIAVAGYLSFGDLVSGNVIAMYDGNSVWTLFGKVSIVFLVLFSYPLQCHPCRASAYQAITKSFSSQYIPPVYHNSITAVIIILSYIAAYYLTSLDLVLAFVGSTGSTAISFILPGFLYYAISIKASVPEGISRKAVSIARKSALALTIYGITVMILCLSINIARLL
ncbi:vacuolar amino acid efflux transporter Avt8 [Schizosaccharomyces japonicus yFS275]|uniref:Vacuolar amino acid efflux transporter Avt8 n=1 Tax=Schizosaccharomyces japonicus (strain yFS275 / FY16936) TaxID=402676 RepID=B6K3R5_SCHJY|nr:vacuolar amino acid efflux transporter Avt8 [Schizosaccharomyces japonicus yFS275]EEB08122.1 vacuolar amino acid efflux transporter Avt8 [Schizosaccharomyces japonicus yFS275]